MTKEVFSLWLMPRGDIAGQMRALIERLSRKHSTPLFEPHVTLIGEINLPRTAAIAKTEELASQIEPFDVTLNEVEHRNRYFRCVFLKADKTPELMNAHSIARAVFGQEKTEEYMPHLSLVYGNLVSQTRQGIIQGMENVKNIAFPVRDIFLYYTGGEPSGWRCLSRIQCGRSNPQII